MKGLSGEELAARNDLVLALPDRIQAIPDGSASAVKQSGGWAASASRTEIKFDSGDFLFYLDVWFFGIHFVFCLPVLFNIWGDIF